MNIETFRLYSKALDYWGETAQMLIAIEEMSELSVELCHALRANKPFDIETIKEEIADVSIMLEQLQNILCISDPDLQIAKNKKLSRLKERIKRHEEFLVTRKFFNVTQTNK